MEKIFAGHIRVTVNNSDYIDVGVITMVFLDTGLPLLLSGHLVISYIDAKRK